MIVNNKYAELMPSPILVHSFLLPESLFKIMDNKNSITFDEILKEIIDDNILVNLCKESLIEYCKSDDIHSQLNVTFKEALISVWSIIRTHKDRDAIKAILNDEMKDSLCKCFTGRLSRLVNCLNGFDDRVNIKISDNNQIANIMIMIRNKHTDSEKIKEEFIKEMKERDYDDGIINEWLSYL